MNTSKPEFKLMIGLGNPGPNYTQTYHNVGALFVGHFKKYLNSQTLINYRLAIHASTAYMNNSGKFVIKMMRKYGARPQELLIVYDDSDIEIGKYKLTEPGHSTAGHHGIESIQTALKTKNFWRLRIGIRPSKEKVRQKAGEFVLKKITAENKKILEKTFITIAENL